MIGWLQEDYIYFFLVSICIRGSSSFYFSELNFYDRFLYVASFSSDLHQIENVCVCVFKSIVLMVA